MSKDRLNRTHTFLNAAAATGEGTEWRVSSYRHIMVAIATDGGGDADLTVQCQGSIGTSLADGGPPDWDAAQTVLNHWEYVGMYDYEDATLTDGDVGFVTAAADDVRLFMVNVDGIEWLNFNVTARAAGEVTVYGRAYSNL